MKLPPQNRYEMIGTIGTGATSRVDKARDSMIGRTVAIKTFLHGFGSGDIKKEFLREAQIIGRLTHPYIVGLYDVGTNEDGVPYLVMEYVEGKTLETTLHAGRLPLERAAVWAADLASALARAHQCKIIHGDVKPANVLITAEGQVKLGDFGIARFATQVSGTGTLLGTPAYLSPEQILGHKQDCRSDLFSLGIILYQMSTGVRPFDGTSVSAVCAQIISTDPPSPSHHNPELPPEFDHVVMRCLAKNPADRYATAEALGASLYPFARCKPFESPRPIRHWWNRPMQASDLHAAAAVLLGLAIFAAGAHAVWHHSSTKTVTQLQAIQTSSAPVPSDHLATVAGSGTGLDAPSVSTIEISSADFGFRDHLPGAAIQPSSPQGDSSAGGDGASLSNPLSLEPSSATPTATHAFERHAVSNSGSKSPPRSPAPQGSTISSYTPYVSSTRPPGSPVTKTATPATSAKTFLHVDIVATVTDETLSVFAGDELLLTTQLQAAHLGDTLRFDCSVTPGEHAFRVVLTRPDESVLMEKANTSEIRPDASNFLGIHVTRRAKLFLKHETALEIVWPSTTAPVAASITTHAVDAMAMR